jgi:hypothetical protein
VSQEHVAISVLDTTSNLFSAGKFASPLPQVVNQGTLKCYKNIFSRNDQVPKQYIGTILLIHDCKCYCIPEM